MTNKKKKQKTEAPSEPEAGGAADPILGGRDVPAQAAEVEPPYAEMTRDAAQAAVQAMADQLAPGSPGQMAPGEGAHGPGGPAAGSTEGAAGLGATAGISSSVGPAPMASWEEATQQAVWGMRDGVMSGNPQAESPEAGLPPTGGPATDAPATAAPTAAAPEAAASAADTRETAAPGAMVVEHPSQSFREMSPEAAVAAQGNLLSRIAD